MPRPQPTTTIRRGKKHLFAQVPYDLIDHPDATAQIVTLYAVLVRLCPFADSEVEITNQDILEKAHIGRVAYFSARDWLVDEGWITLQSRPGYSNVYIIGGEEVVLDPHGYPVLDPHGSEGGVVLESHLPGSGIASIPDPTVLTKRELRDAGADAPAPPGEESSLPLGVNSLCEHLAISVAQYRENPQNPAKTAREQNLAKTPKITAAWKRDMDLLLRRGPLDRAVPEPLTPEQVRRCIDFVFTRCTIPENGSTFCWAANIQSPAALRRQWDKLREAARRTAKGASKPVEFNAESDHLTVDVKVADEAWRQWQRSGRTKWTDASGTVWTVPPSEQGLPLPKNENGDPVDKDGFTYWIQDGRRIITGGGH